MAKKPMQTSKKAHKTHVNKAGKAKKKTWKPCPICGGYLGHGKGEPNCPGAY